MSDWRNAIWNERAAAVGLFIGAITCIIGVGLASFEGTVLPGIVVTLAGLLVAFASWFAYRM